MKEKKGNLLEEKQERREFFKTLGKAALPAIAFLGLGAFGNKLHGSQDLNNVSSKPTMDCFFTCSGGCKGECKGSCTGCEGSCKGGCGDCTGDCKGSCKEDGASCKDDSEKICLNGNTIICSSQTIS